MERYLAVMTGAAFGGLARYLIASALTARMGGRFPIGTFVVNITGCFLIGLVSTILIERAQASPTWGLLLVTGILGGYTTFSAFGWESVQLTRQGNHLLALANIVASVVCGYIAVWMGILVARK
jgi:CrcB protein